jgi:hypothetical protein
LDRQRHALFSAGAGDTLSVSYRTRTKVRQVFGCATILVRVVPSCRIVLKRGSQSLAPLGHRKNAANRAPARIGLLVQPING